MPTCPILGLMSFFKTHFVFKAVAFAIWFMLAASVNPATASAKNHELLSLETATSSAASSTVEIADDAIDSFLFRVDESVRDKVKTFLGSEIIESLSVPILFGISINDLTDSWGEARPGGRVHNGTDIITPRGELVASPTDAVVTKIGYDNRGGNFVITANPGGEQFYFAHLDRAAENLSVGDILKTGDVIGYVGNTGNARGKSPHLHFGIYYKGTAQNPFPRLSSEFSAEQRLNAVENTLATNKVVIGSNNGGVRFLQRFLISRGSGPSTEALAKTGATGYFGTLTKNALAEFQQAADITPAVGYFGQVTKANVLAALDLSVTAGQVAGVQTEIIPESEIPHSLVLQINNNLETGSEGGGVVWLQDFLISAGAGSSAKVLASVGATGYFGSITKNALAEYQLSVGISPAQGYFGSITRAWIKTLGGN